MSKPTVTVIFDGKDQITIQLHGTAFELLARTAAKRGLSLEEMVGEALRLEQLLADQELLAYDGWWPVRWPRRLLRA